MKPWVFEFETSVYDADDFAKIMIITAENEQEIYPFDRETGEIVNFLSLPLKDQLRIQEMVVDHFFMEAAVNCWKGDM